MKAEPVKQETTESPRKKGGKKEGEKAEVWKWWEEEKPDDGVKWSYLEHKGPVFAPEYEPMPKDVKLFYDGKSREKEDRAAINPFSAGTAFMLLQTGWIQASRRVTRRLA